MVDDLQQPNGIIGTPDGKTLYVADIDANKTYAYDDPAPTARWPNKRLFCELGSDGMTIDDEGNVYLTGKGVTVFDKTGKQIEHIADRRGLDRQRLLRRQGPPHAVHHRQQGPLRPAHAREGRRQPVRAVSLLSSARQSRPMAEPGRREPCLRFGGE